MAPSGLRAQSPSPIQSSSPTNLSQPVSLMPLPASLTLSAAAPFRLVTTQTIVVAPLVQGMPEKRLYASLTRFLRRLGERTGLRFGQEFVLPSALITSASASAPTLIPTSSPTLTFTARRAARLVVGEDESYELRINAGGVSMSAETDLGILRGIETLLQTLQADSGGYYFPALTVSDRPRFVWRGLMLDVSRHFMDANHVKRTLDAMAVVKMNVLHWHLSDDQGFRVESKVYPRLHGMGSDGDFYTQEQIRDIIRYADERGIRIMPEFDVPGHTGAWLVGHPELASSASLNPATNGVHVIERGFGRGSSNMDPTRDTTYRFLDRFFGEMATLFPDNYLHIGGDEVSRRIWRDSPSIQDYMKQKGFKTNDQLQHYFNGRLREILRKHGKIMVGWDEIFEGDLPRDIVIHSWRTRDSLYRSVRAGHQGILSWGYYIDLMYPASNHYAVDPLPNDSLLTAEEATRILGGEATMWSEFTPSEVVDSRIWPRTAAIAERFWSPRSVNNSSDMYRRLDAISLRLEEVGSQHERNQAMLVRRILNSNDDSQARTLTALLDVIEPVKEYQRGRYGYSTLMPFSEIVDAARADAQDARVFGELVSAYLLEVTTATITAATTTIKTTTTAATTTSNRVQLASQPPSQLPRRLQNQLQAWIRNHDDFTKLIPQAPKLRAAEPMSLMLASSATIALEALNLLEASRLQQTPDELSAAAKARKQFTKKSQKKSQKKVQEEAQQSLEAEKQNEVARQQTMINFYLKARQTFAEAKKTFAKCELQVIAPLERLVQIATQATLQAAFGAVNGATNGLKR